MKNLVCILFFALLSLQSSLYAQEAPNQEAPVTLIPDEDGNLQIQSPDLFSQNEAFFEELPTHDYQGTFIKMFVVLILLIGLIFLTVWMIKRLMKTRSNVANRSNKIQIIEKRVLSPKSILYLVEVENQKMLISESHLEVRPIQKICDDQDDLSDLDPDFLLAESSKL